MTTIAEFITKVEKMYNLRNGGAGNPIVCQYSILNQEYVVVASVEEPSLRTLPFSVLWLCMDQDKNGQSVTNDTYNPHTYNAPLMYRNVFVRVSVNRDSIVTSHGDGTFNIHYVAENKPRGILKDTIVDGYDTKYTWRKITNYDVLWDILQVPALRCPFERGELATSVNYSYATGDVINVDTGRITLAGNIGKTFVATKVSATTYNSTLELDVDPIAVGDNDQRLTNSRTPLPHNHEAEPTRRIEIGDNASIAVNAEAPPTVVGSFFMVTGATKAGWRVFNKSHIDLRPLTLKVVEIVPVVNNINAINGRSIVNENSIIQYNCRATYNESNTFRFVNCAQWRLFANVADANAATYTTPSNATVLSNIATIDGDGTLHTKHLAGGANAADATFAIRVDYTEAGVSKFCTLYVISTNLTVTTSVTLAVNPALALTKRQPDNTIRVGDYATMQVKQITDKDVSGVVVPNGDAKLRWTLSTPNVSLAVVVVGKLIKIVNADDGDESITKIEFDTTTGKITVHAVNHNIIKIPVTIKVGYIAGVALFETSIVLTVDNVATRIVSLEIFARHTSNDPDATNSRTIGDEAAPYNMFTETQKQFYLRVNTTHPTASIEYTPTALKAWLDANKTTLDWIIDSPSKSIANATIGDYGMMAVPKIAVFKGGSAPFYAGFKSGTMYAEYGPNKLQSNPIIFNVFNNPVQSIVISERDGHTTARVSNVLHFVATATLLHAVKHKNTQASADNQFLLNDIVNGTWSVRALFPQYSYCATIDPDTGVLTVVSSLPASMIQMLVRYDYNLDADAANALYDEYDLTLIEQ